MFTQKKCIPCQGGIPPLSHSKILKYKKLVSDDWQVYDDKQLIKEFKFDNYPSAINFSKSVAELSEEQGHHPYIHINYKTVKIILFTHKIDGLHENDFLMANKIDNI